MPTRPPYHRASSKRPQPPLDTRPRLPSTPGPKPAIISRQDTLAELRVIYRLLASQQIHAAKAKLITLGRNLQA